MRERKSACAEDIEILLIKNQLSAISCCGDVTFPTQNKMYSLLTMGFHPKKVRQNNSIFFFSQSSSQDIHVKIKKNEAQK